MELECLGGKGRLVKSFREGPSVRGLLKRFPVRIWYLQLVVLVVALFLGLAYYVDPHPDGRPLVSSFLLLSHYIYSNFG